MDLGYSYDYTLIVVSLKIYYYIKFNSTKIWEMVSVTFAAYRKTSPNTEFRCFQTENFLIRFNCLHFANFGVSFLFENIFTLEMKKLALKPSYHDKVRSLQPGHIDCKTVSVLTASIGFSLK